MNDAVQLLREWAEDGSEDAFARLVKGHIDLVYSVAVRKVAGNTGLAADITQSVFTDVARKACTLRAEGSFIGWLHRHTCLTAATLLRSESRRRSREQTAAAMHALETSTTDPDFSHLAPLLDDAVNSLGDADRRAVLLRFYERRGLREIGSMLGLKEDAAQKRVTRALDKLRAWLEARGVTSTAAALATALATHGVAAAPAGLAATVTSTALATTAAAAGAGAVTFFELMTHAKAKLAIAAAIAAAVATPVVWQENVIATTRAENGALAARIEPLDSLRAEHARGAQPRAQDESARAAREREELERLRGEVDSLRSQLQQIRNARLASRTAPVRSEGNPSAALRAIITLQDARDVGAATGAALFQTFLWAMRNGDVKRIEELGDWSEKGVRESAEAMFRELPQAVASGEMERSSKDVSFRVLRQVPLEDGDFAIIMEMGKGTDTQRMAHRIRRAGNEWRVVMGKNGPTEVKITEDLMRD